MKSAIALILTALLMTGCSLAPGKVTQEGLSIAAPDVPTVDPETQKQAVQERRSGQCPALTHMTNVSLITRDQARALQGGEQ